MKDDDDLRSWSEGREFDEGHYRVSKMNRSAPEPVKSPGNASITVVMIAVIVAVLYLGVRDQTKATAAPHRATVKLSAGNQR